MPSEVARQAPKNMFLILDSAEEEPEPEEDDPYLKMFYGL